MMTTRLLLVAAILAGPRAAPAAVFTTKLRSDTVARWDKYVQRVEPKIAGAPMLDVFGNRPTLTDLNPRGDDQGQDVPGGYIHHWIGAVRIPDTTVASVRATLENYERYPQVYSPDLKLASATKESAQSGLEKYDVRLVTEQTQGLLHFAFDIHSHVTFRTAGEYTMVESRSYLIRESDSGHAPYTDLLPEGDDHGVLWRLHSYWRLRQVGSSVYAECQVISLSRKPLFGTTGLVKDRARDSLESTLQKTRP
jgi:hypothetical protein